MNAEVGLSVRVDVDVDEGVSVLLLIAQFSATRFISGLIC